MYFLDLFKLVEELILRDFVYCYWSMLLSKWLNFSSFSILGGTEKITVLQFARGISIQAEIMQLNWNTKYV